MKETNFLFHLTSYLQAQQPDCRWHEVTVASDNGRARLNLFATGDVWHSHYQAPFGGPILRGDVSPAQVTRLFMQASGIARGGGARAVRHVLWPHAYHSSTPMIVAAAHEAGCTELYRDVNYHLEVTELPFEELIDPDERRYLRHAEARGASVTWLDDDPVTATALFDVIVANREARGFTLGQDQTAFLAMLAAQPDAYQLVSLTDGETGTTAAVAVLVRVAPHILYTFYTAQVAIHASWSPLVALHQAIYDKARELGCTMLDLGTASKEGIINTGNARFKRKLGAQASHKMTLLG